MNETPATVRMIDGATAPVISNVFVNNACAVCTLQITPTAPTGYTTDNTKGCDIPVILVARDKTEDGETGTVNEQRFDVVSITDDAVDLTRFGNGDNRHIAFA